MKRSGAPKRRKPLPRGKPPQRSALHQSRKPQQRERDVESKPRPPRRVDSTSRRSPVRDSRLQQFHEAVGFRAAGRCEARVAPDCSGEYREAHHVVTRKRGVGWPWLHDASRNGLGVCSRCHGYIHRPPRSAFVDVGQLRPVSVGKLLGMIQPRPATDADPGPLLPRIGAARVALSQLFDTLGLS